MADPRILEEREVEGVVQFPQAATPPPKAKPDLAKIYIGIASVLAARLQCLLLVMAMIVLSALAVVDPTYNRLVAAGGFNVLALAGISILGRRQ